MRPSRGAVFGRGIAVGLISLAVPGCNAKDGAGPVSDVTVERAVLDCSGTWMIDTPTRGHTGCPFAEPHALSFSVDRGERSVARRVTGQRVELQLGERDGSCTATVRITDRYSEGHGVITVALHDANGALTGEMSRGCSEPVALRGRRTLEVTTPRPSVPDWTLRAAYARLLERCDLRHDLLAKRSSRLDFTVSASGALESLSRDGATIDLAAACDEPIHAKAGFLGYPGSATQRVLVLDHRTPDALGLGPLLLGAHVRVMPKLGFVGKRQSGHASFVQGGEERPATFHGVGGWKLFEGDNVAADVVDDPFRRTVEEIRTPTGAAPAAIVDGEFLDLGISADEVLADLDGVIATMRGVDMVVHAGKLVPLGAGDTALPIVIRSPCTGTFNGEPRAFVAGDSVFWSGGGLLRPSGIIVCPESGHRVFDIRAGVRTRVFDFGARSFGKKAWREAYDLCRVDLREGLVVTCGAGDTYGAGEAYTFGSVGRALLEAPEGGDPRLASRAMRVHDDSSCSQTLRRYADAFESSASYYDLPGKRPAKLAYALSAQAREWLAGCELLAEPAQQCLAEAPAPLPESNPCKGAPDMPSVDFDLDHKRVGPEAPASPSGREARALFDRLLGTWGDPESTYSYGARFFRRRGKMMMSSAGDTYEVSVTGRRSISVTRPNYESYRMLAFTPDGRLHINTEAIRPLRSRDRFRAGFGVFTFIQQDGACVMLGRDAIARSARCEFERVEDGAEYLMLAADTDGNGHFADYPRIPVVDGMLVHPHLRAFERSDAVR